MKQKLTLLLFALVTSLGAGATVTLSDVTELSSDKYYVLYNAGRARYAYTQYNGYVAFNASCNETTDAAWVPYIVRFVADGSNWKMMFYDGKYLTSSSSGAAVYAKDASQAVTFSATYDPTNEWTLTNLTNSLNFNGNDGNLCFWGTSSGGNSKYKIKEVDIDDATYLSSLRTYAVNKLSQWGSFAGLNVSATTTAINAADADEVISTFVNAVKALNGKYITAKNKIDTSKYMYITKSGLSCTTTALDAVMQLGINDNLEVTFQSPYNKYYAGTVANSYNTITTTSTTANPFILTYSSTNSAYSFKDKAKNSDNAYLHYSNNQVVRWYGEESNTASWWTIEVCDMQACVDYVIKDASTSETIYIGSKMHNVSDVVTELPNSFQRVGTSYAYPVLSLTTVAGINEFVANATWNGPFEFSSDPTSATKWYVVDMHSNQGNYTWKYDETSAEVQTPIIAKNDYASLTDNHLFCFVGNPYQFKIYNKAAGSSMSLRKESTGNTVSHMSSTDDHNLFSIYASTSSISNSYCFLAEGDSYYLNKQSNRLQGWSATDEGSSCRFFAPGAYHIAAINSWNIDAPVGAVGTKSYITSEAQKTSMITTRTNITNDPFSVVGNFSLLNTAMNPVNESATITLADGYYRIVNYKNSQGTSLVYNQSLSSKVSQASNKIVWSTTDFSCVGNIFYLSGSGTTFSIKNCNKTEYLSNHDGTTQAESANTDFTSLGSAQYKLTVNSGVLHANLWNSGDKTEGNVINYGGGLDSPSAWYIVKATNFTIKLNTDGAGTPTYYATGCWPFDVTLSEECAYTLTLNSSKTRLTLSDAMSEVPAGTPVLLRSSKSSVTASIASDADYAATPGTDTDLTGTYVDMSVTQTAGVSNDYFLGISGGVVGFYHWDGTTLSANRAYFEASKLGVLVKGIALDFEDDATGIDSLTPALSKGEGAIYNLAGQRVNNSQSTIHNSQLPRGIYIVNGRKVLY